MERVAISHPTTVKQAVWTEEQMMQLQTLGSDPSALALSCVLSGSGKVIKVDDLLAAANPMRSWANMPHAARPPAGAFQQMHDFEKKATAASKIPYMYVDITTDPYLPMFVLPEGVGGKSRFGNGCEFLDAANSGSLAQLGSALSAASQKLRWFKHPNQLFGALLRYIVVATTTRHLTLTAGFNHYMLCLRSLEMGRLEKNVSFHRIVLYDKLRREDLARRADAGDVDLDIEKESSKLDKELLDQVDCQQAQEHACGRLHDATEHKTLAKFQHMQSQETNLIHIHWPPHPK